MNVVQSPHLAESPIAAPKRVERTTSNAWRLLRDKLLAADQVISESGTVPTIGEYDELLRAIRVHGSSLSGCEVADIARFLEVGFFAEAIGVVRTAAAQRGDPALGQLVAELERAALELLEGRVGSMARRIAMGSNPKPTSAHTARMLELSADRPTVQELLNTMAGDAIAMLETLIRLVRAGGLVLGAPKEFPAIR